MSDIEYVDPSTLMRIPLPVFYVAEDSEGRLIVVDMMQEVFDA